MKKREVINLNEYKNQMPTEDLGEKENMLSDEMPDELLRAYMRAVELETPDLWQRISDGFDEEISNMRQEQRQKRAGRKKRFSILAAAVLVTIVAVPVLIFGNRRGNKESDNIESSGDIMEETACSEDMEDGDMLFDGTEAAAFDADSEACQSIETNEASNGIAADSETADGKTDGDSVDDGFENSETDMAVPSSDEFYFASDVDAWVSSLGCTLYGQFENAGEDGAEYVFQISGFYSDIDEKICEESDIQVGDEIIITNFDELINDEVDEETLLSCQWKVIFRAAAVERRGDGRLQGAVKGYGPN